MITFSVRVADSEFGLTLLWATSCRWHNLWSLLKLDRPPLLSHDQGAVCGRRVWFDAVTLPENRPVINIKPNRWRKGNMTLFYEKLTQMSEGYKAGEEGGVSIDSQRTADQEKKGGEGEDERERGEEKADAFLLRTCHISGRRRRGSGGRRDRERRDSRSSHDSKTFSDDSWPLLRHFCFRFRKSWWSAWSASFRCRLPARERGCVIVAARG